MLSIHGLVVMYVVSMQSKSMLAVSLACWLDVLAVGCLSAGGKCGPSLLCG